MSDELGVGGDELAEQVAQLTLLGGRERRERRGRFRQQLERALALGASFRRQHDRLHPPVGGVGASFGEAAFLEAVGEGGDVGRVAAPRLGEVAHAQATVVVERAQVHERLEQRGREAELAADPVHAVVGLALHEERVHRRPCVPGCLRAHRPSLGKQLMNVEH